MLVSEAARRRVNEFQGAESDGGSLLPAELVKPHRASSEDAAVATDDNTDWKAGHDENLEVHVTPRTLLRLRQYHGSLVQVSDSRSRDKYHLARLIAVSRPDYRDGVAYLKPLLAFNLGLQLHLQPFLESDDSFLKQRILSHSTASTSLANNAGVVGADNPAAFAAIVITAMVAFTSTAVRATLEIPQPGCQPAVVGVAQSVGLARVLQPILKMFGHEAEDPAQAEASGAPLAARQESREQQEAAAASEAEGALEELVAGVQAYFRSASRFVCVGDVIEVTAADSSGRQQILSTLYGAVETAEHIHLRVTSIRPSSAGASLIDPDMTRVGLEGSCNGYLIPRPPPGSEGDDPAADSSLWRALAAVIAPALHPVSHQVELRASVLLAGPAGSGKGSAVAAAAKALGLHLIPFSCQELRGPTDLKTATALEAAFETALGFTPSLLQLTDLPSLAEGPSPTGAEAGMTRTAAVLEQCIARAAAGEKRVIVVGTTASAGDVPPALRRSFAYEVTAEAPGVSQRAVTLRALLPQLPGDLAEAVAPKTAGLLPGDLKALAADAAAKAVAHGVDVDVLLHADGKAGKQNGKPLQGLSIRGEHLEAALEGIRKRTATALGAPQVPDVRWEDVGGLEDVKQAVLETIELPLKHPELFSGGLRRRSGLLLYGPPGTGKTLVAKAVATECALNFLSVKGPELINMYIGESERQVREVFEKARRARPCVLFFDELDSLAPARGAGADSAGVMDRVVSQLLAEVDGLQGGSSTSLSQDVFLIGATNRPDLLDPALMRPGRLDKLLYVGVAEAAAEKLKVLHALTRKFRLAPSVRLAEIADACGPTLTGADLYALCADAWMGGLRRVMTTLEEGSEGDEVEVEHTDFQSALSDLTPSLSQEELARYLALRQQYRGF